MYYHHRQNIKMNPNKYAYIIAVGMDQMKLLIPSLLHQMKVYSSAWRLKTHLTDMILNHDREVLATLT